MDIYLIRHTRTAAEPGLCYGQSNIALANSFPEEARALQQKLPVLAENHQVFSSPLTRCLQLAELISANVSTDKRLLEIDFGAWEGLRFDAIDADVLRHWTDNFVHVPPPNGESFTDLCRRADSFWQDCLNHEAEQILIVTHAGFIRALLAQLLKLPPTNAFQFRVDVGSVHKLQHLDHYTYINYLNL